MTDPINEVEDFGQLPANEHSLREWYELALSLAKRLKEAEEVIASAWEIHASGHHYTKPENHYRVSMDAMDKLDLALTKHALAATEPPPQAGDMDSKP